MSSLPLPILKPKAAPPEPKQATQPPHGVQREQDAETADEADADTEEGETSFSESGFPDARSVLDFFSWRDGLAAGVAGNSAGVGASVARPALQTALEVSEPGDELEQEAEKVADHVMRMAEPSGSSGGADEDEEKRGGSGAVQRRLSSSSPAPLAADGSAIRITWSATSSASWSSASPGSLTSSAVWSAGRATLLATVVFSRIALAASPSRHEKKFSTDRASGKP